MQKTLILASASPRRKELLESLGLKIVIHPAHIEEIVRHGEDPSVFAVRMSREKALAVAACYPNDFVIGADTIVVLDKEILGKPKDEADAARMLKRLSGQEHKVITGFSILNHALNIQRSRVITSTVFIKRLTDREINGYIATKEPMDKAGSYAVQGIGSFLVGGIIGSYSNVVGLPLCELLEELEAVGAVRLFDEMAQEIL